MVFKDGTFPDEELLQTGSRLVSSDELLCHWKALRLLITRLSRVLLQSLKLDVHYRVVGQIALLQLFVGRLVVS